MTEPIMWAFNPTPSVTGGYAVGRAVPDLSANADPFTGYLVYAPSLGGTGIGEFGGTGFVAPQLNGSAAVIDSFLGHRVGFWNPVIYAAATGASSPFTQLDTAGTSNDNIYYTGNPGAVYNEGDGLGIPDLTEPATFFPKPVGTTAWVMTSKPRPRSSWRGPGFAATGASRPRTGRSARPLSPPAPRVAGPMSGSHPGQRPVALAPDHLSARSYPTATRAISEASRSPRAELA